MIGQAEGAPRLKLVRVRQSAGRSTSAGEPDRPVSGGVGRQAAWNYLIFALSKSSTLLMTMVLARLLSPSDFGLFALALVMFSLFDYFRDLGVAAALVQNDEKWARLAPTGLTLSAIFGPIISLSTVLLAPAIAGVLGHPELTSLVQVLAIGLLISSAAVLPHALLRRRIDFRGRLIPEVTGALVKMAVSISLAVAGAGVWSLVWGQLGAVTVTTGLYWAVARPRVRLGFDRRVAGSLLRFGVPVTALGLLGFLEFAVPTAVVGRRLGSEDLGLYSLAFRLPELLLLNLCIVIGEVLFSVLSRVQGDRQVLASRYLSAVGVVIALTAPLGLGIAVVARDLMVVLYGSRYAEGADVLAVLAVYTVLYSAGFHSGDVYKAIGRPMILTYLSVASMVVLGPTVWIAAGYSTVAVAAALLCFEIVHFAVRIGLVAWVIKLPVRRQLRAYRAPLVAAVLMALVVATAGSVLPAWPAGVRLALLVPLGGLVYLVLLQLFAPATVASLLAVLGRVRSSSATRPTSVG